MAPANTTLNPDDDVHAGTKARKTTTPEVGQATPSKAPPPTAAQIQAQQRADTEHGKQPTAPANGGTALVAPSVPTAEERAQRIAQNIAKLGVRGAASVTFNGNDGGYVRSDGANLPAGTLVVLGVRDYRGGFCNFRNGSYEEVMRLIDEVQVERGDLDGGYDTEPGLDGQPRSVWQEQTTCPIILTEGGHEMLTLVCRNAVSRIALDGLVSNCYAHPLFKRGLLPIVQLGVGTYLNKKLKVKKPKPVLRICGWVNTDGTPADVRLAAPSGQQQSDRITSGPFSDEIPFE